MILLSHTTSLKCVLSIKRFQTGHAFTQKKCKLYIHTARIDTPGMIKIEASHIPREQQRTHDFFSSKINSKVVEIERDKTLNWKLFAQFYF